MEAIPEVRGGPAAEPLPSSGEPAGPEMRGARAGAIVFVGIAAANLGNYLFHLVSAHYLGPARYGDLASLLALAGLIGLPLAGIQFAIAAHVARLRTQADHAGIAALYRRSLAGGLQLGAALALVLAALAIPVQRLLGIASTTAIVLTALTAAPAVLTPVVLGLAQGLQRFTLFSVALASGAPVRVVLGLVLLVAGLGVSGAVGATLTAAAVTLALPLLALRRWRIRERGPLLPVRTREIAFYLVPVTAGLLAMTSLTTIDVIVAKASFSDHDAGLYGGASLIGRVILYLPAAVVTVLLPKVSARSAAQQGAGDILVKSLLATGAFCAAATVVYALGSGSIVRIALGKEFSDAGGLLWMFALAMTGYALLNVLLAYHIGRGETGFLWLLAAGALVQLGAFSLFHGSATELLVTSMGVAGALLAIHAALPHLGLGNNVPRGLRRLPRRFQG